MKSKTCESETKIRSDFLEEIVKPMVTRRKALKMTQAEVNDKLGVIDFLVAKWECGMRTPTSFNLLCWAEVLRGKIMFTTDKTEALDMTKIAANNNQSHSHSSKRK